MRWFFSMKRTNVSPGGMPRLSNSSISDGRSSAFADTSPRYTPTHCDGCSLMRRGRSFESISADFENSRSPLAISSGLLPRRERIGLSGSVIRSSSLKRHCRRRHDPRQSRSSGRLWAEHDAESTALKCRRHARDVRFAIGRGAPGPAVPGNARAVTILPRSSHRRDSVLSCACFCLPGHRRLNAPATSPATIAAQTNSVPVAHGEQAPDRQARSCPRRRSARPTRQSGATRTPPNRHTRSQGCRPRLRYRRRVPTLCRSAHPAEHHAAGKHHRASVRNVRLHPPADHRQKTGITLIVGRREPRTARRVTVHLDHRQPFQSIRRQSVVNDDPGQAGHPNEHRDASDGPSVRCNIVSGNGTYITRAFHLPAPSLESTVCARAFA